MDVDRFESDFVFFFLIKILYHSAFSGLSEFYFIIIFTVPEPLLRIPLRHSQCATPADDTKSLRRLLWFNVLTNQTNGTATALWGSFVSGFMAMTRGLYIYVVSFR